jgi:hypothetical protein
MIRKGTMLAMSTNLMRSPEVYKNPDQFDGYRYWKMQDQPGYEHLAQLISTTPDHMVSAIVVKHAQGDFVHLVRLKLQCPIFC